MRGRRQPALLLGALAGTLVLATGVLLQARETRSVRESTIARLRQAIEALAVEGRPVLQQPPADAIRTVRQWAAASGLRVTVIGADGVVHADSARSPELLDRLENHIGRPEIRAAARGEVGIAERRSATTDRPQVYAARLIGSTSAPLGYLRLASPLPARGSPWLALLAALAGGAAVAAAVWLWQSRSHAAVARHLAGWTELDAESELAALAEEADRSFRRCREEASRELDVLRAALGETSEGIVLLDREMAVRFANPAAAHLLGEVRPDHPLVEATRAPAVLAAVRATLTSGAPAHTTLEGTHGRELAVRVCPLPHPLLAAAVVLRDVSGERRLERARRALVADLAHELRTPVTVLGALAEELGETGGDPQLRATLSRQVHRLAAFAEELEDLTAIESGQLRLHLEEVDATDLARQVLDELRPRARRAGVALRLEGGPCPVVTDPVRLAQVLTNLIDNAIRYNRPDGEVVVEAVREDTGARLRVADTGIGIPAADVPLVFQRFYRVRRGSETMGGAGLGLAIVKHLVHALGGEVQLSSREGEGTEVRLLLPLAILGA